MKCRYGQRALAVALVVVTCGAAGCATLATIGGAFLNLKRLQFRIDRVSDFRLGAIPLDRLERASQLNIQDMARLATLVQRRSLPVSFTLDLQVRNPNLSGSGQSQRAVPLFLRRLAWTLAIDDRTTINGLLVQRLEIPASGDSLTLPLTLQLDLYQFFGERGFDDLLGLAFAIGGARGSSSHLALKARVTVEAYGQTFDYPDELTIVDRDFTAE